tara:strand:+ start:880 stop:2418 length:1539 start_codon:yes stop_codon:yes gene_type:complete
MSLSKYDSMKTKFALLTIMFSMLFYSCEDDLEKLPLLQTMDGNYYTSEVQAFEALVASYDPLQYNFSAGVYHFRWFLGNFTTNDVIPGGSGPNDQPQLQAFNSFSYVSSNIHLNSDWTAQYQGIYRTNALIGMLPGIDMNDSTKAQMMAEGKFLRAFYYFNLVTAYGGVPFVDHVLSPNEFQMERAEEDEIWDFIELNLDEAIDDLRLRSELRFDDYGRVTKGAARALLLKTLVYREKWFEALTLGKIIIATNQYSLAANYEDIFTIMGENGPGSIFEIQRSSQGGGYWGNVNGANDGNLAVVYQLPRGAYGGWGFNIPQQSFVDEFESGDPRLNATVFQIGDELCDRGILSKSSTGFEHDFYSKKYFACRSEHELINIGDPVMNGEVNDRVIRYADVLLLTAEAAYYQGDETLAKNLINQVRARARKSASDPNTILPDITSNGQALLLDIYHERDVELGLEGEKFFDLVRTGRAATELANLGFEEGKHEQFPIPQRQIDLSGGNMTQNEGY